MWMVALRWLPKAFERMDPPVGTAGWLALAAMSAILSLFWSVPIVLAREFANRNPGSQLLATSSLFALGEWARSTSIIGFPWNPLGAIWLEVPAIEIGRASCRERGCQSVSHPGDAVSVTKQNRTKKN